MTESSNTKRSFTVCVRNAGYETSLGLYKIYPVLPDTEAEKESDIRVVDESGEDYLYPSQWFVPIEVPSDVEAALSELHVAAADLKRFVSESLQQRLQSQLDRQDHEVLADAGAKVPQLPDARTSSKLRASLPSGAPSKGRSPSCASLPLRGSSSRRPS